MIKTSVPIKPTFDLSNFAQKFAKNDQYFGGKQDEIDVSSSYCE